MASLRGFGEWLSRGTRLPWERLAEKSIEAAEATAGLGEVWQDAAPKLALLKDLDKIDRFFALFDSPAGRLAVGALPFASLGIELLRLYWEVTQEKPSLARSLTIAAQMAYLQSLQEAIATADPTLLTPLNTIKIADIFERQLQKLETVEVSFTEATSTLSNFPSCVLAKSLNDALEKILTGGSVSSKQARALAEQVSYGTPQYFHAVVAQIEDKVPELKQFLNSGGQTVQDKYASIERYLTRWIDPLPLGQVFDDEKLNEDGTKSNLTFEDLYVPLSVQRLDVEGKNEIGLPLEITDWARGVLDSPGAERQVMFIQGEAGRGKSVFCRMFSRWVRERFAKAWVPILIRLRDVQEIKDNLSETLKNELENEDFVISDRGWLTDPNVRFLLIFDGFDELLLEGRESGGLKDFLQQVAKFQEGSHHQCLITGRPLALQGIDKQLTRIGNLERVRLDPMTDEPRVQWLAQWGQHFTVAEANAFCDFLGACPREISDELAREPLLLYLLGRLHREEKETFNAQMFAGAEGIRARIQVYDQSIRWVLEKQRQNENVRLAGLDANDLREVLQEAALCVVQSGNETAKLAMLRKRFVETNNPISQLFEQAQDETKQDKDKTLNNLLTTFYLQPGKRDKAGSVEFAHKSFGEFLFAERLVYAFEAWVERDKRGRFRLNELDVAKQIYDLLGYGALTDDIVEYLKALLVEDADLDNIVRLFHRLHDFYDNWSEGSYIDKRPGENLPQGKMIQFDSVGLETGLRQVDVYTGLNVMIVLFELHRYGQHLGDQCRLSSLRFHPCGKVSADSETHVEIAPTQLLCLINYSRSIHPHHFLLTLGNYLNSLDLSRTNLSGTNLSGTNLSGTNLSGTNLSGANLSDANLRGANLRGANLSDANLGDADLNGSNLSDANLMRANLSDSNLSDANLMRANLSDSNLSDANLMRANLGHANLSYTDLSAANLYDAELCSANLHTSNLSYADLRRANLYAAKLLYTNLYETDLSYADLSYADLLAANISYSDFFATNLSHANLHRANFSYVDFCDANLSHANFGAANANEADLENVRFDEETVWNDVRGLDTVKNMSAALKLQLGFT